MKHFVIILGLAGLLPAPGTAALGFPWFRTHPKPVLLDPLPPASEEQHRVAWHGTAVYPSSGRLYFKDSYDHFATKSRPANARGGSRTALPKRNQ